MPRSAEDQIVDRVLGDLRRVAKAQWKEFLTRRNVIFMEQVEDRLRGWAQELYADVETREMAKESGERVHMRRKLVEELKVARQDEKELRSLEMTSGLSYDAAGITADDAVDDEGKGDGGGASGGAISVTVGGEESKERA